MGDRVQKAIAEYCRSHTYREAAEQFQVSTAFVMRACDSFGVVPRNKCAMERERIAAWAKQNNATIDDAVSHFGCSTDRAVVAFKEHGLAPTRRSKKVPVSDRTFAMIADLMRGFRQCEIAEKWDVSRQYVAKLHKRASGAGIPIPNAKGGA